MEIVMIVAMVLLLGVAAYMAVTIVKNNKKHSQDLHKLKEEFSAALKQATDSINSEGAAQTDIIKQKSNEEQALLMRLQISIEEQVSEKLSQIEHTALSIHTDVHDNLQNIIFDNFPSREDKIKSRVMDKLMFAVRHAARNEAYMKQLMGLLDNGAAVQNELDAANAELNQLIEKQAPHSEQMVIPVKNQQVAQPQVPPQGVSPQAVNKPSDEELDEQLRNLSEMLGVRTN